MHAGILLNQLISCAVPAACRYTVGIEALLIGHEDWVHSVEWAAPPPGQTMHTRASVALLSASMDRTMIMWTYEVRMHACVHGEKNHQQQTLPILVRAGGGANSFVLCSALRMRRPPTACGSTRPAWATQAAAAWATLEACSGQAARPSWRTATQVRRR